MTVTALARRFTVPCGFTLRNAAIVTEGAQIKRIRVREGTRNVGPRRRRYTVAIFTGVCCVGMSAGFSSGGCSIVTAETGTKDLGVIQGCDQIYPGRRRNHVAGFTHV